MDDLTNQIEQMRQKLDSIKANSKNNSGKHSATVSDLSNISTASPSVNKDIDHLQKKVFALEENCRTQNDQITQMMSTLLSLNSNMENVLSAVTELNKNKADTKKVENLVGDKASQRHLDYKVDRPYFDNAIRDLVQQNESLSSKIDDVIRDLEEKLNSVYNTMNSKMDKTELDPFKTQLEGRLKALKKLLEITKNEEANAGGVDQDAFFRKPMIGYQSVAYDAQQQYGQQPHASIPTAGALPQMNTIRPYTTFDMHTIRNQSHFNRTAMDERDFLKSRKNNEYGYRKKVAGSMNYAFNAYEQGTMTNYDAIPCHGGSSIPPNYAIPKLGRSCGGIYTMTTPHRRFTKVKVGPNDQQWDDDVVNEQDIQQSLESKIQQQFNNPQEEVELCGHDGHIYKGRMKTDVYQSNSNHQANSETEQQ